MSGKRIERVAHLIRDEISRYLQQGLLKDPRIGFVTISGVRVSKDLRHAKVYVSVFGEEQEAEGSIAALQNAQGFVRRKLGKDLRMRRIPDIQFILDSSIEQGIHMTQVLQEITEAQEPPPPPTDWLPLVEAIVAGQRFLVAAHRDPDGDAVGSTTALVGLLLQLGKEVVLFNDGPYPHQFYFLPYTDRMVETLEGQEPFDVSILCDCGEVDRGPKGFPKDPDFRGTFLVIDHHLTSRLEGDICYNDPAAPAVGILIYDLCQQLGATLTPEIAKGIYCALISDTGGFRYQKTTPKTFRVAAELLEAGVDPWEVASGLFESSPIERQYLLARALDTLELAVDDTLAFLTITQDMMRETGATRQMTDGFINFGRGVNGVEVAVLFREEEEGWKVSFRSRGRINVAEIAGSLGGGGHHNAAGATTEGELQQLKTRICSEVARLSSL